MKKKAFTVEMTTTVRYAIVVEVEVPETVSPDFSDADDQLQELAHEAAYGEVSGMGDAEFLKRVIKDGADVETDIDDVYEEE